MSALARRHLIRDRLIGLSPPLQFQDFSRIPWEEPEWRSCAPLRFDAREVLNKLPPVVIT
jgi:hypothetical protein